MSFDFIDISPLISERLAVYPGDVPFSRNISRRFCDGDRLTLSSFAGTMHLGAHADAPSHYFPHGESIENLSLAPYFGPCQVVSLAKDPGSLIALEDVEPLSFQATRVLFRTASFADPGVWREDFVAFAPEAIAVLARGGVQLVGIDTPSLDPAQSEDLPAHQMIARHDMRILEGLDLQAVLPGVYFLVALPLKIAGADATPVRAVLLKSDWLHSKINI